MKARNLKRTLFGRPSPYVKISLRPGRMQRKTFRAHHGSVGKTRCQANTTEPYWPGEVSIHYIICPKITQTDVSGMIMEFCGFNGLVTTNFYSIEFLVLRTRPMLLSTLKIKKLQKTACLSVIVLETIRNQTFYAVT